MFGTAFLLLIYSANGAFAVAEIGSFRERIFGGLIAMDVDIPYIVSLQWNGEHVCGGSIINERTILTAAHCFEEDKPSTVWKVLAGSKDRTQIEDVQLMDVETRHIHESYGNSTNPRNDIALMRLTEPLRYNVAVQPIDLPESEEEVSTGTIGLIAGWGYTNAPKIQPIMLRYAMLPVWDHEGCQRIYNDTVTSQMFCAGYEEGGVDSCQADSGGPFVSNGKLIGIVSWGAGCALPNIPGIYTRVSAYIEWIDEILMTNYEETIF